MRPLYLPLLLAAVSSLSAAEPTALAALKLIPRDRAVRLARIEARDGTPSPDRWYLIVHDPEEQSGVHEFVVANNEVVASRVVSQFAETVVAADVFDPATIKVDSDQAAKIARQYAQANNASVAVLNFQLKKDGAGATPVWKVSCVDEKGVRVGEVTVTAGKGNVVSHEGFLVTPRSATETKKPPKFEVYAESQVVKTDPAPSPGETEEAAQRRRRREADDRGNPVGNAMKSMGRGFRRILPF